MSTRRVYSIRVTTPDLVYPHPIYSNYESLVEQISFTSRKAVEPSQGSFTNFNVISVRIFLFSNINQ
jgi:hypothetical protein